MPLSPPRVRLLVCLSCLVLWARPVHAGPTCEALARGASMEDGEPLRWAAAIWGSLRATDERLSGLAGATVHFIADAEGLASGAWFCPGEDTVHVTQALVDYAWQGRAVDGASLLGFVLAHELAHRRFDAPGGAAKTLGSGCETVPSAEVRADERAAFLLALAPDPTSRRALSPFQLERRDSLDAFFASELGWPRDCPALVARVGAVRASVLRMRQLGRVYDTAIALALLDALPERLPSLMAALDAAVNSSALAAPPANAWAAVPEVTLARALVHLSRAAKIGWCPEALARAPLAPSACALRCPAIAPAHALLSPIDAVGARAPRLGSRDVELAAVQALLAEATRLGATPAQLDGVEACRAFAAGDSARRDAAIERLATEVSRAGGRRPLIGLRMAARLQSFLLEENAPVGSRTWSDALREVRDELRLDAGSEAGRLVASWLGERAPEPAPILAAPLEAPRLDAWVRAEPCAPTEVLPLGDGWSLATSATCADVLHDEQRAARLVEVTATALSESLEGWARLCTLEARGSDDAGAEVVSARCPAWDGPDAGWLLFVEGGRLRRGVRFSP